MRIKNLICSVAMVVMLCFTAFAIQKIDRDLGTTAAIDSVERSIPAVAVATTNQTTNHFEVADRAACVVEGAVSPPEIAMATSNNEQTADTYARGWIPTKGDIKTSTKSPPAKTDTQCSVWTPNIGYNRQPTSVPPWYQTARSGSFA